MAAPATVASLQEHLKQILERSAGQPPPPPPPPAAPVRGGGGSSWVRIIVIAVVVTLALGVVTVCLRRVYGKAVPALTADAHADFLHLLRPKSTAAAVDEAAVDEEVVDEEADEAAEEAEAPEEFDENFTAVE